LLRPIKAPAVAAAIAKVDVSTTELSRPAWDTSWIGLLYGGNPIALANLMRPAAFQISSPSTEEDEQRISEFWNVIDDAYLANTTKSIDEYWQVQSTVSKSPRWNHVPSADSGTPTPFTYVPPVVSMPSERVTSSHSYLQSHAAGAAKLKSRPDVAPSDTQSHVVAAPEPHLSTHPVYKLPARSLKVMKNLMRQDTAGGDQNGKVSWKDLCKVQIHAACHANLNHHRIQAFTALGFTIDDTTPGSAVTFIPPSAEDRPISIHR